MILWSPSQDSVVFTSNNTAVHEVFDRCIKVWDSVYKSRAYVFGALARLADEWAIGILSITHHRTMRIIISG
jgi:hypothetical protein